MADIDPKLKREEVIVLCVLIILCILAFLFLPKQEYRVYNCNISEISPDIPVEAKEACRKLRMDQIK
jgi:hypothetical protein